MAAITFLILFIFVQCSYSANLGDYKSYEGYKLFEIQNSDGLKELLERIKELDETVNYAGNKTKTEILVAPRVLSAFEEIARMKKLKTNLISDDFSEVIRMEKRTPLRSRPGFSWTSYYDVDDIYGYLKNMSNVYANLTELIVGGDSYERRQILGLRINNPLNETGKPAIFIESGIHAREWITPATTTYFINQLLASSDPEIVALRDQFDWHIFPTVNPDGYHYSYRFDRMWRKTRSRSSTGCYGADANRNWDYNWLQHGANDNPCDYQVYGGKKPFSEIETRTLAAYISSIENLQGYIAFHSTAQILLVPYSDSTEHTDNYDDLIQIGKTSLDYGYKVNGEKYGGPATAAEILYKASGGSMDWVRNALGTPVVYTYELRGSYFTWPASRIYEQGDEVTQMMLGLVTEARNLGYF